MKRTNRLILVVGILLAVVAFVGVFFLLNQKGNPGQQAIAQANVVVATRDIKLGEAIQENQVEQKQIPLSDKKPEYVAQTGDVIGQVARTDIAKGAYLTVGMFSGAGQASLSKDLPAGMRAVAVRVDAVSGVGTLILPGDRVDLAMTVSIQETGVNGSRTTPDLYPELRDDPGFKQDSSKLILQNVEVRSVIGASVGRGVDRHDGRRGPAVHAADRHPRGDAAAGRGDPVRPAGGPDSRDGAPFQQHHPDPEVAEGPGCAGRQDDRHRPREPDQGLRGSSSVLPGGELPAEVAAGRRAHGHRRSDAVGGGECRHGPADPRPHRRRHRGDT